MKSRLVQFLSEFGRVFGCSESVNESLESGDGGVDLKHAGSNRLRRVLFAVDLVSPAGF